MGLELDMDKQPLIWSQFSETKPPRLGLGVYFPLRRLEKNLNDSENYTRIAATTEFHEVYAIVEAMMK